MYKRQGHNCVLDPEAKEFEIAYKGQEVAVDYVTMELTNQRQKVSLSLLKKDAETGKPVSYTHLPTGKEWLCSMQIFL